MEIDTAKFTFTQIFWQSKMLLIAFQHNAPKNAIKHPKMVERDWCIQMLKHQRE